MTDSKPAGQSGLLSSGHPLRRRTYTGAALAQRKAWARAWGQVSTIIGEYVAGKITYDEYWTRATSILRREAGA